MFRISDDPSGDRDDGPPADIAERLSAIFALEGDDAWTAMAAWRTVADALRIDDWVLGDPSELGPSARMVHSHRSAIPGRRRRTEPRPPTAAGLWSAPSGSSTRSWSASSDWSTPTGVPGGWDGWTSTSASCSTGTGYPDGPRRPSRSPGSPPRTSISPSWWRSRCRPARSSGRCAGRVGICSSRSSCSMSTEGRRWRRGRGAWPSGCGSAPWTARSPTRRWAGSVLTCIDAVETEHRARLR